MASLQTHAMSFLLRHTLKKNLNKAVDDVPRLRKVMAAGRYKVPADIEITGAEVGGVPGEWVQVRGSEPDITLLYLHGGGYFACSPRTHRSVSCWFARRGMRVFVPDYRLAPEHPFPAALDDARAVYKSLREELGSTTRLLLAGDSAGGGLSLALMVAERDAGHPLPKAALLFSPWTDLSVSGESVQRNAKTCAMFTPEGIPRGAALYLADADPRNPLASPLFADLKGLPPLLIHASEHECLRDDSVRLAQRAKEQGVTVSFQLWPAVPHVWQLFHPIIPEGRKSLREAESFAQQHLGEPGPAEQLQTT